MRNIIVALTAMFIVSFVPIRWVRKVSVAAFAAGCLLLLATELVGVTVKGATRWLDIGVRIQPSEIMKLAVPMMLAWYYWKRAEQTVWWDHLLALAILSVPVAFILKQPDLGNGHSRFDSRFSRHLLPGSMQNWLPLAAPLVLHSCRFFGRCCMTTSANAS